MQIYELGYLILPSIAEDALGGMIEKIKAAIVKEGGVAIDGEAPFKQSLAYSMSKTVGASRYVVSDAYLGWIKFEIEPAKLSAIKADVEKMPEILRFLLIKAPREAAFTFAKARAAAEAKENSEIRPVEEAVIN